MLNKSLGELAGTDNTYTTQKQNGHLNVRLIVGTQSNIVLRSLDNNSGNWADAEFTLEIF